MMKTQEKKGNTISLYMCILRVIHIRLDTALDELSCKKEKRNCFGLGYFRSQVRFFFLVDIDFFI